MLKNENFKLKNECELLFFIVKIRFNQHLIPIFHANDFSNEVFDRNHYLTKSLFL